ncbi:MAG: hypothetical protein IT280_06370 [Ignavibacteria bacterium]|nr:hypothetical protein [Ignavibacteria bacterium]
MKNLLEEIFGINWRTTIWGGIMTLALAINQAPTVVNFLPDNIEVWVRGISGLIVIAAGIKFAVTAKG